MAVEQAGGDGGGAGDRSGMRASDADRAGMVETLRAHLNDGRITVDEFSERVSVVYASRTEGELRSVLRDLPDLPPVVRPPTRQELVRRRWHSTTELRNSVIGFLSPNVTCIGIWALAGRGYFWPGWVLLATTGGFLKHLTGTDKKSGRSPWPGPSGMPGAPRGIGGSDDDDDDEDEPDGDGGVERAVATVMFADVVESTVRLAEIGDARWRRLLESFEQAVASLLGDWGGRTIFTRGDEVVATFDIPARAVGCACAVREMAAEAGLSLRIGIHAGEVDRRGDDVTGIALHIGHRVLTTAEPGEILVSATVRDLTTGSGLAYADRGEHELKGVPGRWRLYAAMGSAV